MEQPANTIELSKPRSYAACIKEGFRLLADNPWKILRSSWPYLLIAALCSWFFYVMMAMFQMVSGAPLTPMGITLLVLSYVLLLLGTLLYSGRIMLLFQRFKAKGRIERIGAFREIRPTVANALHLLPFVLIDAVATFAFGMLAWAAMGWAVKHQTTTMLLCATIALFAVGVLTVVFMLPLVQSLFHCQLAEGKFVPLAKTGYRHGFRHKGKLFVTNLLAAILYFLASLVVAMPLFIVMSANIISSVGVLMGDAPGTPSYFPWLTAATYVASFALLYFVGVFIYSSNLFAYGSIEAQERERETIGQS